MICVILGLLFILAISFMIYAVIDGHNWCGPRDEL